MVVAANATVLASATYINVTFCHFLYVREKVQRKITKKTPEERERKKKGIYIYIEERERERETDGQQPQLWCVRR